ncbi:MAG: arylsulfatase [Acidobacteria bacterium]|nr:arylsulfatase [Acidobacteriota bacterium]
MLNRRQFLQTLPAAAAADAAAAKRPNIILLLADDLGYSDPGCYGGEIETPNLNRLAKGGTRFTQLYNSARCCPSRAALLTGRHPHAVGMGNMVGGQARADYPGYAGQVPKSTTFLPAVMREAGYSTLMAGKWHLGQPGPVDRGFEEFYGMVHGFDSFWNSAKYTRLPAGRPVVPWKEPFYSTDAITDHALNFLNTARQSKDKPWFLYLAYNAPHFPLHAPKDLIDKYQQVYEQGWDVIREKRFERMRRLGLIDPRWKMSPRSIVGPNRVSDINGWADKQNPAWDTIPADRRKDLARRMAVFAAMVDRMDQNIGRVLADLETKGELDNTLILFCADNGACAEWDPWGFDGSSGPNNVLHTGAALDGMGQPGTYHSYGSGWANTCNTPWRLYKHYTHEGGISTPTIVHWPAGQKAKPGGVNHQPWHFIDVLPTLASVAGAKAPVETAGTNMAPMLQGRKVQRGPLFWEHEGSRAVRDGKWKITAVYPKGQWELYDIEADRTEQTNLAARDPDRVKRMAAQWDVWAKENHAVPWIWKPQYGEAQPPQALD